MGLKNLKVIKMFTYLLITHTAREARRKGLASWSALRSKDDIMLTI